jgi:hypothetical protein
MHYDTRRLTVARDHLQNANDEIVRAIGLSEASMAQQAVQRALAELDLVLKKLGDEQGATRGTAGEPVAACALSAAQHAWQRLHDALNDWEMEQRRALKEARDDVRTAIDAVDGARNVMVRSEAAMP